MRGRGESEGVNDGERTNRVSCFLKQFRAIQLKHGQLAYIVELAETSMRSRMTFEFKTPSVHW